MTLFILTTLLALSLVPGGHASPTRVRDVANNCVAKCRQNWGWPGHPFPNDPWGLVVDPKIAGSPGDVGAGAGAGAAGLGGVEATPSSSTVPLVVSITTPTSTSLSSSSTPIPTTSSPSQVSSSASAPLSTHTPSSLKPSLQSSSSSTPPPPPRTSSVHPTPSPSPSHSLSQPAPPPPAPSSNSNSNSNSNAGSGSTSGPTSESDIQAYLAGHNNVRAQHGAAPLTYSQDLAAKAQQWANGCVFKHSGGSLGPFGENLAAGTSDTYGISDAIKSWTDEASQYNAANPVPSHFTQVVWKATTQVGCALQLCDGIFPNQSGKASYYVCEYSSQGNIIGEFATNVQA